MQPIAANIVQGTTQSIDNAKIVCLPEKHGKKDYLDFEKQVFSKYYDSEKDLILIECAKSLTTDKIIQLYKSLFPAKAEMLKDKQIRGWDHRESILWDIKHTQDLKPLSDAMRILKSNTQSYEDVVESFLFLIPYHNKISSINERADRLGAKDYLSLLNRKNIKSKRFDELKKKILISGAEFAKIKHYDFIYDTFAIRHESLIESIEEAINENRFRKIFVIAGEDHFFDKTDFANSVKLLFESLQKHTSVVLQPGKS